MKKRYLILLIIIITLILCLGVGFTFAYFFTDSFKSNKNLFLKYISKNSEITELINDKDLKTYFEKQNTTPYTSEGIIKTDVTFPDSSQANISTALQNCNISFTGKTDKSNNYIYRNIKANYSDYNSLDFEFIKNNNIYALKINDVLKKFIGIKNENLKELCNKMGISEDVSSIIPDKIDLMQIPSINNFSKDEISQIKEKYTKIVLENLTDNMFSQEKNDNDTIYTLTLNMEQCKKIYIKFISTLKDDEALINKIKDFIKSNSNIDEETINTQIETYKNKIQEIIDEENELINDETASVDQQNNSEKIFLKVYVQKGKLNKTDFIYQADEKTPFELSLIKNENSVRLETKIYDFNSNSMNSNPYENNNTLTNNLIFNIQKINADNEIKFDISSSLNNNQLFQLLLNFNNIKTSKSQEIAELNFDYDDNSIINEYIGVDSNSNSINANTISTSSKTKISCKYTNSKNFDVEVSQNDVQNSDIMLINSAPNSESVLKLLNQVGMNFVQLNNTKMTSVGLKNNENPFIYYIPAIIPVGITTLIQNNIIF